MEGTIGKLFEGRMHNFVECVNVDFKSTRQEVYADLQLLVRGCKDMYDSFNKYVEVEDLNGQNQYQAEGHGLQVRPAFTSRGKLNSLWWRNARDICKAFLPKIV